MKFFSYPLLLMFLASFSFEACKEEITTTSLDYYNPYYPSSKPMTRWWWFATEIKKMDIEYQLDWLKENNFGGVEIAWVYPLYRYQRMYERNYDRCYPVDTSAQKWLSPEWSEVVSYTKQYADEIGMSCDFTFGSAWPVASSNITKKESTQIYGDTSFTQTLTFAWSWPDTLLVINHLDSNVFNKFAKPISDALGDALTGTKSAMFTDSWEIKLNGTNKIWTEGYDIKFQERFGYDIIPFMEEGLDSFPDVRYDYMLLLDEMVREGFYEPFVKKCKSLGAWSRVQCLASPTDVMTTYGMVDIPETEAMLNNPSYSSIVSSSACLSSKPLVSSESFTCMYGFPSTYLRREQTADLKMVADALFAKGVNHHVYHGTPYNPIGSDSIEFFATSYFGPGGALSNELPAFNTYMERVSALMQEGKTYSDVAVYIPFEDGVMKGAYPKEKQRVWVWGEYEMRYIDFPKETKGYHPLWVNRHFLEKAVFVNDKLYVGDAQFNSLYIDVNYMDLRSLERIVQLANEGLSVCLKNTPIQPGKSKSERYIALLKSLKALPNVSNDFNQIVTHEPLVAGEALPEYWCRVQDDGSYILFLAQLKSKNLKYPVYSGQSKMERSDFVNLDFSINGKSIKQTIEFKPYQSIALKINPNGKTELIDITFIPKDPIVRPREKQKMYF